MGKGKSLVEKRYFLDDVGLLISAREKILNNFKDKIFPTKNPEPELQPKPTVFDTPKSTKKTSKEIYIV